MLSEIINPFNCMEKAIREIENVKNPPKGIFGLGIGGILDGKPIKKKVKSKSKKHNRRSLKIKKHSININNIKSLKKFKFR